MVETRPFARNYFYHSVLLLGYILVHVWLFRKCGILKNVITLAILVARNNDMSQLKVPHF